MCFLLHCSFNQPPVSPPYFPLHLHASTSADPATEGSKEVVVSVCVCCYVAFYLVVYRLISHYQAQHQLTATNPPGGGGGLLLFYCTANLFYPPSPTDKEAENEDGAYRGGGAGWHEEDDYAEDSQIGQLLFYMLVGQLQAPKKHIIKGSPHPVITLGVFICDGMVRDLIVCDGFMLCLHLHQIQTDHSSEVQLL